MPPTWKKPPEPTTVEPAPVEPAEGFRQFFATITALSGIPYPFSAYASSESAFRAMVEESFGEVAEITKVAEVPPR